MVLPLVGWDSSLQQHHLTQWLKTMDFGSPQLLVVQSFLYLVGSRFCREVVCSGGWNPMTMGCSQCSWLRVLGYIIGVARVENPYDAK